MICEICGRAEQPGIPFVLGAGRYRPVHRVCWERWATELAKAGKAALEAGR